MRSQPAQPRRHRLRRAFREIHRYRSAALLGVEATRTRTSKVMAKEHALVRRLIERQDDSLRLTVGPQVPFDCEKSG